MPPQENELTEPFVRWIEAEMARREWKQAELGRRAKVGQDVLSRTFKRETAPDPDTLKRLARAFGLSLAGLQIAVADSLREGQEPPTSTPRLPQDERSALAERAGGAGPGTQRSAPAILADRSERAAHSPAAADWAAVLEALSKLPKDVQRQIAVRAVLHGIEAQELQGPHLLRAMVSLCRALDDLGYPAMAREIRSDLLKAMEDDLAQEKPEEP